jgi:hypothetical protein
MARHAEHGCMLNPLRLISGVRIKSAFEPNNRYFDARRKTSTPPDYSAVTLFASLIR